MNLVFTSVSWKEFIEYTGLVLFVYYALMAWMYRKDLLSWWKYRRIVK